jgi:hypothetical protein
MGSQEDSRKILDKLSTMSLDRDAKNHYREISRRLKQTQEQDQGSFGCAQMTSSLTISSGGERDVKCS